MFPFYLTSALFEVKNDYAPVLIPLPPNSGRCSFPLKHRIASTSPGVSCSVTTSIGYNSISRKSQASLKDLRILLGSSTRNYILKMSLSTLGRKLRFAAHSRGIRNQLLQLELVSWARIWSLKIQVYILLVSDNRSIGMLKISLSIVHGLGPESKGDQPDCQIWEREHWRQTRLGKWQI